MEYIRGTNIKLLFIVTIALLISLTLLASDRVLALSGSEFKAGRIIDNSRFFDGSSMTATQIQNFLEAKVPDCDSNGDLMHQGMLRRDYAAANGVSTPFICLKDFEQDTPSTPSESGLCSGLPSRSDRSAAQIIDDVADACNISQKVLLVLLQKEQSLITDDWPWPVQYESATGFACPDTAPCDDGYGGFFEQVYYAARQYKRYQTDPTHYNHRAGVNNNVRYHPNSSCGSSTVFIENQATAGLYNYTPYQPNQAALNNLYGLGNSCSAYGNRNFWRLYNDWFGPTIGADNIRLIMCDDQEYLVERGIRKKRLITSTGLAAWNLENAYFEEDGQGCGYNAYPEDLGRLIRSRTTGRVYMVDSGEAFKINGSHIEEAWGLGDTDSQSYPQFDGDSIHYLTVGNDLPVLGESANTNRVYLADSGNRHEIEGSGSGNYDSLLLLRGNDDIPMETFSGTLLQTLTPETAIDYSFQIGSNWYLLDYNKTRKINPSSLPEWTDLLTGPVLSSDVLSLFDQNLSIGNFWQRDSYYYRLLADSESERTSSDLVADDWGAMDSPGVTRLLKNKIVSDVNLTDVVSVSSSDNIRLISCGGQNYMVERGIHKKRLISSAGLAAWGLENAYFVDADPGCGYTTYAEELGRTVRSRDTGRVYLVDSGKAFRVMAADGIAWGLGDVGSETYPQLNGASISFVDIEGHLPKLARSANTSIVYLVNDGNRYEIVGSNGSDTSSLELVRGYDEVPMDTFSAGLIQTLTNGTTIDYSFSVGGNWYVLDHNRTRRVDVGVSSLWDDFLTGPALSSDVLSLFGENLTIGDKWRRDSYFYRLLAGSEAERTEDVPTATSWNATNSPVITRLLRGKLVTDLDVVDVP